MGNLKMHNLTAIILCGGKGLRLRPLTNDMPKPLIEIDNNIKCSINDDNRNSSRKVI